MHVIPVAGKVTGEVSGLRTSTGNLDGVARTDPTPVPDDHTQHWQPSLATIMIFDHRSKIKMRFKGIQRLDMQAETC